MCRKLLLLPLFYLGGEGGEEEEEEGWIRWVSRIPGGSVLSLLHFEKVKIHSGPSETKGK